jgi:hypothetical protein
MNCHHVTEFYYILRLQCSLLSQGVHRIHCGSVHKENMDNKREQTLEHAILLPMKCFIG